MAGRGGEGETGRRGDGETGRRGDFKPEGSPSSRPPVDPSPPRFVRPTGLLEVTGLTKSFGAVKALDHVDLSVRAGEIHGVLGENGAGKSTLMNVLAGIIRPDTGRIMVDGRPLRPGSPHAAAALGIGLVHQHFSLVPALTAAENLSLAAGSGPAFFRRSSDLARSALRVAERLGWRVDPDTPVWQLPVGRQQRLEILKVLQRDAQWLLFDEPTAVLSPDESEELFRVIESLRTEGRGIVFISHKLREVLRLCDRVTVLRRGRVVAESARGVTASELGMLMVGEKREETGPAPAPPPADAGTRAPPLLGEGGLRSGHVFIPDQAGTHGQEPGVRSDTALVVRDVRVRDERSLEAVRGISFEVGQGEILGIAGVDGNGQDELAEAVLGLRRPQAGLITQGASVRSTLGIHREERPGYIPGDRRRAGLVLPMSVRENLVLEIHAAPGFRWGPAMRLSRLWRAASEMSRRFDIRVSDLRQPAATLSGGNQQKIVVARALSSRRSLLVAVNPTRGLDIGATRFVHTQLRAARASGVGVLLISTDLDEVLDLSDRIGVLFEGRLQGIVTPSEPRQRIGQMMGGGGAGLSASNEAVGPDRLQSE